MIINVCHWEANNTRAFNKVCTNNNIINIIIYYYIPSSITFLWLLGNYDVIYDETYDETYGVIYEVITRKFRASMEPFCHLKISKYVE